MNEHFIIRHKRARFIGEDAGILPLYRTINRSIVILNIQSCFHREVYSLPIPKVQRLPLVIAGIGNDALLGDQKVGF